MFGFKLSVTIEFKATKDPNKYEPPSPRNILAFGKLKRRKEIRIMICAVKKKENSKWLLFKFTNNKTELMINKLIVKTPLNPSIKFAPFTINKKHKRTNTVEKISISSHELKKDLSICTIFIGRILIKIMRIIIININLKFGLIFILISSKYPTKNKLLHKRIYS